MKTLSDVRKKFGTFITSVASAHFHRDYRGNLGPKIVICTTAEGVRGNSGKAFIDLALSPEQAQTLLKSLKQELEEYGNDK